MDGRLYRANCIYFETLGLLTLGYVDHEIAKIRSVSRASTNKLINDNPELYEIAEENREKNRQKKKPLKPLKELYERRKKLISQGLTPAEIAAREKIKTQSLRNYVEKHPELKELMSKDYIYERRVELAKCMTAAEIADKEGINADSVHQYLKNHGIKAVDGNKQRREERYSRRAEMIEQGFPLEEIARRENMTFHALETYLSSNPRLRDLYEMTRGKI